jgi:ABC-type nitrate/sulfonate/bicarbonate transport system permease component
MASTASMLCLILVTLFSKSPVALHYTDEFPSIRRSLVCLIDFLQAVSARKITPLTWIWFQVPPLGVLMISGCSVDFFINILLTILG